MVDNPLEKTKNKYYLSGYSRLNTHLKRMMAIVTCTVRVSEGPLILLLKDNSLALKLPEVEAEMEIQYRRALSLPKLIIDAVAKLVGISSTQLRDDNAQSVQTQVGYAREGLREVKKAPWTWTRGNIAENLRTAMAQPKPAGAVAGRIWESLQQAERVEQVVPPVKLLGQTPWTTKAVEDLL